jgi:hypothetical protein
MDEGANVSAAKKLVEEEEDMEAEIEHLLQVCMSCERYAGI